jgi:glutamate N-acetyltransferase/amino-acid N-acetyltransferase
MTTDTRPKLGSIRVDTGAGSYTIAGIVKGAGMIAPNMATMLSVIATDAAMGLPDLNASLKSAAGQSYNRIVVDGDTSTNDTVLLLANGMSGATVSEAEDLVAFQESLDALTRFLAQEVVRDGEGVTKFITLNIVNAESKAAAEKIGQTIGASVLTKSAFYGSDANWGRIVAAAGRANTAFDPDSTSLWVAAGERSASDKAGLEIFSGGMPSDYREEEAAAIMAEASITFTLDCGIGAGEATIWTCDISHEYISINGDYRS